MLLIVFGAGASYDSIVSRDPSKTLKDSYADARLPLAQDLFSPRQVSLNALNAFPDVAPLFSRLVDGGGKNGVEGTLSELSEHAGDYPERNKQFIALRLYLNDVIRNSQTQWLSSGDTQLNHITLFDNVKRLLPSGEEVLIVTFNYDSLIEAALARVGHQIHSLGDFTRKPPFRVLKLHGSIDWLRATDLAVDAPFNTQYVSEQLSFRSGAFAVTDSYFTRASEPQRHMNLAFVPAIAVPLSVKTTFECPKEHLVALESYLPHVTHLLSIGWRGQEEHFLKLLRERGSKGVHVAAVAESLQSAEDTVMRIGRSGVPVFERQYAFSSGFSGFVKSNEGEAFLKAALAKRVTKAGRV